MDDLLPPIHPGETLREDYLPDLKISASALARHLGVSAADLARLLAEQTPITPDTALRLGRAFGQAPEFWMNMQARYDLKVGAAPVST